MLNADCKNILAGGVGTLLEWAEFSYYAYLITKLSSIFFPPLTANAALFMGFGTFAVSYIARPVGGIIFGYLGDKKGRKNALASSILLMGLVTFAIGIIPGYHTIGILAPVLLIILRFLQGLAVGGEFTGAAIFVAEHTGNKSYLSSSWISTFSALGMLIGASVSIVISLPEMPEWAWRIPFLLGALGCAFGLYIRINTSETGIYAEELKLGKLAADPLKNLFKNYKMPITKTATLAAFVGIYIYTCNIWWVSYVIQNHYFNPFQAHVLATIGQASVVILTPVTAFIAEYVGGRLLMSLGFIGAAITAYLLFLFSNTQNFYLLCSIQILYAICNTGVTGTMFKYLTELFPIQVRYSGQAISWSFAVAIFGGTAPLIAQYLSEHIELSYAPSFYVVLSAIIALIFNSLTSISYYKYQAACQ